MVSRRCPQGHEWQVAEDATVNAKGERCPTCGAHLDTLPSPAAPQDPTIDQDFAPPQPLPPEGTVTFVNKADEEVPSPPTIAPSSTASWSPPEGGATMDFVEGASGSETAPPEVPAPLATPRRDTSPLERGHPKPETQRPAGEATDLGGRDRTVRRDEVEDLPRTREAPAGSTRAINKLQYPAGGLRHKVDVPLPKQVAGYEILGELGRGGMGVVYKARQPGLNRVVALKMILAGSHASSEQLERFRREAEAVAQLQHPNIVQVYEVGEENGCPFFSLEFIDGESLDKIIIANPLPPTVAARLVQSLAEAMFVAHQRGIIHRDLKPANVLLQKTEDRSQKTEDRREETGISNEPRVPADFWLLTSGFSPKITDFGLAKRFEDADEGQTRSGAIMGTPSYMAPEQAQGRTRDTGPAADIYSLGAILYDLLTGRPPFRGTTVLDTLQQVQKLEPVPPARLQPHCPRDLDTICLKALQKDPGKRYATAGALAEDLRRFLAGEPILARPTPWWERSIKWMRRHPAWTALVGVSILAVVSLLTLGGLWLDAERRAAADRELQHKQQALLEKERAEEAALRAQLEKDRAEVAARQARAEAERATKEGQLRREAERQQRRAETNFQLARQAVDELLSRVGQENLAHVPHMERMRQELLQKALLFFKRFQEEKGDDPSLRRETGRAQLRVADILHMLGQHDNAAQNYQQALATFQLLTKEFPEQPPYRQDLAAALNNFGNLQKDLQHLKAAEKHFRQALALRQQLVHAAAQVPENQQDVAASCNNLGLVLLALNQAAEAEPLFQESQKWLRQLATKQPQAPRWRQELARTLNNLGKAVLSLGRASEAGQHFQEAAALLHELVKQWPATPEYRQELALAWQNLGYWLRDTDAAKAEKHYRDSLQLLAELSGDFTEIPQYRQDLANAHNNLAILLQATGRLQEADAANHQALAIQKQAVADFPRLPNYRRKLADSYNNRGVFLLSHNRVKDSEEAFGLARDLFDKLAKDFPDTAAYRQELAGVLQNLGTLQQARQRPVEAEKLYRQALALRLELAEKMPAQLDVQQELASTFLNLAALLHMNNRLEEADKVYRQASAAFGQLTSKYAGNPDYAHQLAVCHHNHGVLLRARQQAQAAEQSWLQALTLLRRLTADFPTVPAYPRELARCLNEMAISYAAAKQPAEAERTWQEALRHQEKLVGQFPGRPDLCQELAATQGNLGLLAMGQNELAKAEGFFRKATTLLEEMEPKVPLHPTFARELIKNHANLAGLLDALKRPAEADKSWLRVVAVQEKLAAAFPQELVYRLDLGKTLNDLALRLAKNAHHDKARAFLQAAITQASGTSKLDPANVPARQLLALAQVNLGGVLLDLGDHAAAVQAVHAAAPHLPTQPPLFQRAVVVLARCVRLAETDKKLTEEKKKSLGKDYGDRAMDLLRQARAAGSLDSTFVRMAPELAPLRTREDFGRFVRELEGK